MKRENLVKALANLGYPLVLPSKEVSPQVVMEVLDALADSDDPRLIEGFPVILANCVHSGLNLNIETFFSRHPLRSQKRRALERLLLVSSQLLSRERLQQPEGLARVAEALEEKYGDLLSSETLPLATGRSVSTERLRNALYRYKTNLEDSSSQIAKETARQRRSFRLHMHLSTLFSPKQKELVLKRLNGEPFTKTEQEYYSRVVKKKLEALANSELRKIATKLTRG